MRPDSPRVLILLLSVVGVLFSLSLWVGPNPPGNLRPLFAMRGEGNLAAWLSSAQLLLCAAVCVVLARRDGVATGFYRGGAVLLTLLSIDEACAMHERLGEFLRHHLEPRIGRAADHQLWELAVFAGYGLICLGIVIRCRRQLRTFLSTPGSIGVIVGGAVMVLGGIVLDLRSPQSAAVWRSVEDALELAGESIVLYSLLVGVTRTETP